MTEQLVLLAEHALEFCKAVLTDREEILPQIAYQDANGAIGIIGMPHYGDPEQKRRLQAIARHEMKKAGAIAYVFHMEAWVGHRRGILPSKDPNRGEALIIMGNDINGNGLCWHHPIRREGGFVWLGDRIVVDKWIAMSGPIAELLAPNRNLGS